MSNLPERIATNFESDLQNIIYEFINENFGQTTTNPTRSPASATFIPGAAGGGATRIPSAADQQRADRASYEYRELYISTLRDMIRDVNTNIQAHEVNMREYIHSVHSFLSLMQSIAPTNQPVHTPVRPPAPPRARPFAYTVPATPISQTLQQNLSYLLFPNIDVSSNYPFPPLFQNVVVRPTPAEIDLATEVCEYDLSMNISNLTCPITLETFQPGDPIRRIHFCGHAFKCAALDTWFNSNVRCPLCRYDVRTYQPQRDSHVFLPLSPPDLETESNENDSESTDTDDEPTIAAEVETIMRPPTALIQPHEHNAGLLSNELNQFFQTLTTGITRGMNVLSNSSSDEHIYRVSIPIDYEEEYDASDNLISRTIVGVHK